MSSRLVPARTAFVTACVMAVLAATPRAGSGEELLVSAAVSLSNAFQALGQEFERERPNTRVLFNFGASGHLLQQMAHGAPVDVFASADQETMDRAQAQRLLVEETRSDFARNQLILAVPASTPLQISSLDDLKQPGVTRIAIGKPDTVPAGHYAQEALELAGLWEALRPKYIFGQNVRQVLDYLERGEVDAAFIYASDALIAARKVRVVLTAQLRRPILYPVAVVAASANQARAREFVAFVLSEPAQKLLKRYGFTRP